jgi:hypothetical protein
MRAASAVAIVLAALLSGCGGRASRPWANVREVTPPFLVGRAAADAAVAADRHGRVALTWVTRDSLGQDLWLSLSSDSGLSFAEPVRINPRAGSVSSRAESRPLPVFGPGGELLVAWSERRDRDEVVADLVVRGSSDAGRTLGPVVVINDDAEDAKPVFHGFPALAFLPGGEWFAAWMDHRETARSGPEGSASIFYARSRDGGQTWTDNVSLTGRACPCCRPSALGDANGMVAVAYRSARHGIRDPALAVSRDGGLRFPLDTVLVADQWRLRGCPVDGPALATDGQGGGQYAWYTGAYEGAWIAPWRGDGGIGGMRRAISDSLVHAGHPRLGRLGAATLIALEGHPRDDSTRSVVAVRVLDPDGTLSPWLFLGADAGDGWLAATDDRSALVAWRERGGDGDRVRLARITRRRR